ncbi:hypothetical protein QT972_00145 [Microcoleus sp. herbarium7]|uniref:hypothetical protein n=1 Tax=Microcoleus sp. herbarium7 TaxID=3055435 RepID=UPI002FD79448
MADINDVNGNPAIKTDEPMSIQEANEWALEQRDKADARKAAIERLKCQAAKRRERKPANPLETLKPNPTYKVGEFNAETDAFNVESSDGKKLLGKSLSNGNVRNGQKVRSFFTPNGQVVIDVKPKGRDIVIPKPLIKKPVEEEFWPCTVAFLYSRIKPNQENLRDNFATDKTSWDAGEQGYSGSTQANLFFQRTDTLGDYETADDALVNNLKESRKLRPGTSGAGSGGGADNAAWDSGSADGVRVWFYIGELSSLANVATTSKIISVGGPPMHPSSGNIKDSGPGYCLVINSGFISSAIFPDEQMGAGPLTKELKKSFPNLGGKIGYWGGIAKWGGEKDYASGVTYYRRVANAKETAQTPTSFPASYIPGTSQNPWLQTDTSWFQFGWGTDINPMYIGCIVSSHVNVETSFINSLSCGAAVPPESWFWGGDTAPYRATIDRYRTGWNGYNNLMYVCWEGHRDNIGLAQSFFEAFRVYWGLPGTVVKLASCGRFGCEIGTPGGGGGYPPAPPGPPRFLVEALGRKAEIWLKVCDGDSPPIELKLPFEFAAVVEKYRVIGNAGIGAPNSPSESNRLITYGAVAETGGGSYGQFYLENPHATLAMDEDFAYVNISYGAERVWEEPLIAPIPCALLNLGAGKRSFQSGYRIVGAIDDYFDFLRISGQYYYPYQIDRGNPRYIKDCFLYCQTFKIKLPTEKDKTLTIVASQRYKRGEVIALTANSPDTEFDQKFLIVDFRTNKLENIPDPRNANSSIRAQWQNPNQEYAGFGGLPALIQFPFRGHDYTPEDLIRYMPKFYKPQDTWTKMDWLHHQLQESPRFYAPLNTVLPLNVFSGNYYNINIIFDLDRKFNRLGRPEIISNPSPFGVNGPAVSIYSLNEGRKFPHLLSFKEQLIGSGLIKDNKLLNWYRITASSFPIEGQAKRNPN